MGNDRAIVGRSGRHLPWYHSAPAPRPTPPSSVERAHDQRPVPARRGSGERAATRRRYLMCRPTHFAVTLRDQPVDGPEGPGRPRPRAAPVGDPAPRVYLDLGHRVDVLDRRARPAGHGLRRQRRDRVDGTVLGARFRHAERAARPPRTGAWFAGGRLRAGGRRREYVNEGEGDLLVAGPRDRCSWPAPASAPTRARTPRRQGAGPPGVPLELVDPRYYHLDTALAVLDERHHRLAARRPSRRRSQARAAPPASRTRSSPTGATRRCSA